MPNVTGNFPKYMSWKRGLKGGFVLLLLAILCCAPPRRPVEVPRPKEELRQQLSQYLEAYREGRLREAIEGLESLRLKGPEIPQMEEGLYVLALAHFKLGHFREAAQRLEEFLQRYPRSVHRRDALLYLVRSLREMGRTEEALELSKGLLREGLPFEQKLEILWFLSRQLRQRDPLQALHFYDALLQSGQPGARSEALGLIAALGPEELEEVMRQWRGKDFGIYASLVLAREQIRRGNLKEAEGILQEVQEEAEGRGFGQLLERVWLELVERKGKEVKVGLLLPLSGRYAPKGRSVMKGAFLAAGIFGPRRMTKVRFLIRDTGGTAQRVLEGLGDMEEVDAVIGPLSPEGAKVVGTRKDKLKVLSGRKEVEREIEALLEEAGREGIGEIGILYPSTAEGRAMALMVQELAKEQGLEVPLLRAYRKGTVDFGPVLSDLKESESLPEALLVTEDEEVLCLVASQLAYLDLEVGLLGLRVSDPERLLSLCGRYLHGALISCPFFRNSQRTEVRAFVRDFREVYRCDPDPFAFMGFKAMLSILEGETFPSPFLLKVVNGRLREIP